MSTEEDTRPQEPDPPEVLLVVKAAGNLGEMWREGRDPRDIIRATDALGRALVALKAWLRDQCDDG